MLKVKGGWNKTPPPTISPSIWDIVWAAGIFEGEGSAFPRIKGKAGIQVSVCQNDPWILYKLRDRFGGTVSNPCKNRKSYTWWLFGPRAMGFLYTIFTFLSPRRKEQVKIAILSRLT